MRAEPIALPLFLLALVPLPLTAAELKGSWRLKEATTRYTVDHPLKTATGISRAGRGLVRCSTTVCDALIAVEVKSFDSGDSNRDLHMLETVKGALHPVVTVRSRFAPRLGSNGELSVDLEIELAGRKSTVRGVTVRTELLTNKSLKVVGNFIIQLSDFGIERPSLLGMAVKDSVPIEFISTWEK
jgi:hypothetical protein